MRITDNIRIELLYKQINLIIPCDKSELKNLQILADKVNPVKDIEYEISIKPKRKKRSLDANSYFWVLVGKLSEKLDTSNTEIYQKFIREYGVFQIIPIKETAIERWLSIWEHNGIGWFCDDMGKCKNTDGYHNIKAFYGSSVYDSKEMSRLIDAVVHECKLQGIETMTENEILKLKEMWENGCM